jgi:arylsulfatase A-like enzyme
MEVEEIPQRRGPGIDFELLPGAQTLATRLGDIGYERMGFTDSYVVQHIRNLGQGFPRWETPWPVDDWAANYPVSGTKTTSAAIEWLSHQSEDSSHPYFLFLHYRCTHDPYGKNARWKYGDTLTDDYDSAVNYCDDEIGRLLQTLDKRKDKDRTATILFSDHGELFGEHGFTNHGNTLFQPDVRSVLLVQVPGLKQVQTVTSPVSLVDIEPTILMLAGAPPDQKTHAWNLMPFLTEGDKVGNPTRPLFLYSDLTKGMVRHESRGVIVGPYKVIRDLSTGTIEMFDVVADPEERVDVSAKHPTERANLGAVLEAWEHETSLHRNISAAIPMMQGRYPMRPGH